MEPQYDEVKEENRKSRIALIIGGIVIAALIAVSFFFYQNMKQEKELKEEATALTESLEKERGELSAELATMRNKNVQMDSLLSIANTDLESRAYSLDSLLKTKGLTVSQLKKARGEIASLRALVNRYKGQVDSLARVNKILRDENTTLQTDLSSERTRTQELSQQNTDLTGKVELGALLKASDFKVRTYRIKRNGKEDEGTKGKNVDHVQVCFNVLDNKIATAGNRELYMRIIGPTGSTMYTEEGGGGKFLMRNGTENLYTNKIDVNYRNATTASCGVYDHGKDMDPGNYTVELYSDGSLMGNTKFELK